MEKITLGDEKVASQLSSMLVLKINVEEPTGRDIALYYRANSTPVFVFLDSRGKERARSTGFAKPAQFLEKIAASYR